MTNIELRDALRNIGLALHATHNTVATDVVGIEPTETSWRVDHQKELALIDKIEAAFFNKDTCPVCGGHNRFL